jgi:hypothetical protein
MHAAGSLLGVWKLIVDVVVFNIKLGCYCTESKSTTKIATPTPRVENLALWPVL